MIGSAVIDVVAAVVEHEGRVLLTRRLDGTHLGGMWEFPGGKIADGESHAEALRREIREELDAGVQVHDLMLETTHMYPDRAVRLSFYRCTLAGPPRSALGQEMRWVLPAELGELQFPEADRELLEFLKRRAASPRP
jgi:8-oxo-dGTP diphosphatase